MNYSELNKKLSDDEFKEYICDKINNLENKLDIVLSAINSLVKQLSINSSIYTSTQLPLQIPIQIPINNNDNIDNNINNNNTNNNTTINNVKFNGVESKVNNYRAFISSNAKMNKSPGRAKIKSTERVRITANSTLQLLNKEKEKDINKNNNKETDKVIDKDTNKETDKDNKKHNIPNIMNSTDNDTDIENKCNDKLDNKKKKQSKNNDNYKEIKREKFDLDKDFIKKCLNECSIESDIKIFKKIYTDNVSKEYYPIRCFRKKLQYWYDGHMNEDISGNYIKDTIINNIENCYMSINTFDEFNNEPSQFIRNQEYINNMNDNKYKERFMSLLIDTIKI